MSSCSKLMVGVEGMAAVAVTIVVEASDVSNSACCSLCCWFGSGIVGLPASLLLCLTPSVERKLMLK